MTSERHLEARSAIEALRAGVPNRSAIRLLASKESALAQDFRERLQSCRQALRDDRATDGILLAGAFGAGKSHHLGYLAEFARQENWIVSLLAISKETPLFDAAKLFAAAVRTAIVPDINDDLMIAALQRLGEQRQSYDDLAAWTGEEVRAGRIASLFAALLWLVPKKTADPDDLAQIARFFGGAKLGLSEVKRWLRQAGAAKQFAVSPVRTRNLTEQRLRFAPRLLAAAGFAGWGILLDEVELIGRYSPLQRGRSYGELARWLGIDDKASVPGILAVAAITEDFADEMFVQKGDDEKIPSLLEGRGLTQQAAAAALAIARLKRADHRLTSPDERELRQAFFKIRTLYEDAYGWRPPEVSLGPPQATRFMRQYVKSWITAWDIQRIYHESPLIKVDRIAPAYTELSHLEEPPHVDEGDH